MFDRRLIRNWERRLVFQRYMLFAVFLLALYFPSSIFGNISVPVQMLGYSICILFCMGYAILNRMVVIYTNICIGIFLIFLLLFFTLISYLAGVGIVTIGALMPYVGFIVVLSLDLRSQRAIREYGHSFLVALVGLLVLAWGVIGAEPSITNFQSSWYQAFYDGLFEGLVVWYVKPVTVFATHSFAAFVYFLFTITCYELYSASTSRLSQLLFLAYSVTFCVLILLLLSTSAFFLTIILLGYLSLKLYSRYGGIVFAGLFVAATVSLFVYLNIASVSSQVLFDLYQGFSGSGSGFSARFGAENRQYETYKFMFEDFNFPIGLIYNENLVLGDNFVAEYVIRVSLFGYIAVLMMLYNFLRINVRSRLHRILIFTTVVLSDLGYPLLVTFRFVFLLPYVVLLLNGTVRQTRQ